MKLILTGGFLGSGKTTAIEQGCRALQAAGIRVGVITNDQGARLVDTGFLGDSDIPVKEVPNGCFCCNYDQLDDRIRVFKETNKPEVLFAEAVGSCTDMVATVLKPMLKFHADIEVLISVFADAQVLPVLIKGSRLFAAGVNYIYNKQLEEADVIVVNKTDLVTEAHLEDIRKLMRARFPNKIVLYQNSLANEDVCNWLAALNDFQLLGVRKSLEIDYELYGAGEAELAWLDEEVEIYAGGGDALDAGAWLINTIYSNISRQELPIGHLKFLVNDGRHREKISFTTISPSNFGYRPEKVATKVVKILINARVQAEPCVLKKIVSDALDELADTKNLNIKIKSTAVFKPGYPEPVYRFADVD